MTNATTITATLRAWITSDYEMRRFMEALQEGDSQDAAERLIFSAADMDSGACPWTCVGDADVKVRVHSQDELVRSQLASLNKELESARAEWLTKQQQILERISKLQALEYVEAA